MPSISFSILNEKKNTVPIYYWDYFNDLSFIGAKYGHVVFQTTLT